MSSTRPVSRFEALPPEIFNQVLDYIFDPVECFIPESATLFRNSRFDTTILRVSNDIRNLSASYLHHSLSWIRFDFDWDAFLFDPHWVGIPYLTIDRKGTPKAIPYSYAGNLDRRSPHQQAPNGRIQVHIKFPAPVSIKQKEIRLRCVNSSVRSFMSILVSEENIDDFLLVLRMHDIAYCQRMLPDAGVSRKTLDTRSDEGMSFDIRISPGQELKKYQHLINKFKAFHGPYHEMKITGSKDDAHAAVIVRMAELCLPDQDRRQQILRTKPKTYVEGIKMLMYLKSCGDKFLRERQYANAYMCYDYTMMLEEYLGQHDPQPDTETFWKEGNDVYKAFGISLACNLTVAHTAGALDAAGDRYFRHHAMVNFGISMMDMSLLGTLIGHDRYLELWYTIIVYHMNSCISQRNIQTERSIDGLQACLGLMVQKWRARHGANCCHEKSTITGRAYQCAKSIQTMLAEEPAKDDVAPTSENEHAVGALKALEKKETKERNIIKNLEHMRSLFKGAKIEPLKWAIRKGLVLNRLRPHLTFLPSVQITSPTVRAADKEGWSIVFPRFDRLDLEDSGRGEKGVRYLI